MEIPQSKNGEQKIEELRYHLGEVQFKEYLRKINR